MITFALFLLSFVAVLAIPGLALLWAFQPSRQERLEKLEASIRALERELGLRR